MSEKYYGKYRGTVAVNADPQKRARIQAIVPDVSGLVPGSWAMPCLPLVGKSMGSYMVPQIGAGVWIEYEQGDPDFPIWTGGFWGSAAEVPAAALAGNPASPSIVFQTGLQNGLTISDLPGPTGGILIKNNTGAMIAVSDTGITISNGQGATITLTGPIVSINNGALAVK
ncbi:phage baseplate assembly protein V [Specibacter cremeus]|uniref:phage baseplate assembly protein V n=1 Tax=Specibacter cremeus TaxID=1629051 RepID=UPI000F7BA7E7|nr:phage baseplate assembly protein V [Specibacter cremeus]